jgi:hypothetical protein
MKSLINTLREMLTYMRPAGSRHERIFRAQFLLTLPGAYIDNGANIHVHVSDDPILWSAHTDTVHRDSGRQFVQHAGPWLELPAGSKSNCLGADDTAGCFILREMIRARVPGHYVFHHGEERGGIGSSWLARNYADWLTTFKYAIALDRANTFDVITHQAGGRCASDDFGLALAIALSESTDNPDWFPCKYGVYTDTAEYADLIPECTNLSVGYYAAHSARERLNVLHVISLLEALCSLDVSALPAARDPHAPDPDDRWPIYSARSTVHGGEWENFCDTCDLMERNRFRGICPDCGNVPWLSADEPASDYLDPQFADVQRALRIVS